MTSHRIPLAALAALLLLAGTADAQLVRGAVKLADGTPVAGAIVSLLQPNGTVMARGYSRENGYFEVRAPGEGRYGVNVDRSGYETFAAEPVSVAGLVTELALTPASKRRVIGTGPALAPACRMGLDLDGREGAMWDQVRQDLEAVVVIESSRQFIRQVTRYERTLDLEGKKIQGERSVPEMRVSERPFLVPGADSVAKVGYVHGDSSYFAFESPDARVFIGEVFRAKHCFSAVAGERTVDGRALVGLHFGPVGTPTVTDIEGIFWLDREAGTLAEIEWSYVPQPAKKGRYGGVQQYRAAEGRGLLYLAKWSQRLPIYVQRRSLENKAKLTGDKQLRFAQTIELDVVSLREDGGEVVRLQQ